MNPLDGCITNTMERNWNLGKQGGVEEIVRRLGKSDREIEKRFNKDSILKSKTTRDHHYFLQPIKRLKSYLLCKEESQEQV